MNREIKFKSWDSEEKVMLDPVTIEWLMVSNLSAKASKFKLMQYTGRHDKNGVEIYEGDKVWCTWTTTYDDKEGVGVIEYHAPSFIIVREVHTDGKVPFDFNYFKTIEVIGNIYENPELLSKDKK